MSATDHLSTLQFPTFHGHDGERTRLPNESEDRCTGCGHRLTDPVSGAAPVETRYLGPARWANEIPRRKRAMKRQP